MNIAINTLAFNRTKTGMGNYIVHLVDEITKLDKTITYIIVVHKATRSFFPYGRSNIRYIVMPSFLRNNLLRLGFEQFLLPILLIFWKVDVYHNPGFSLPLICPAKKIITIADMTFFSHGEYHTFFKKKYFKIMIPWATRTADAVLAISTNTKMDLLNYVHVPDDKIITTLLGVDNTFVAVNYRKAKKYLQERYNISGDYFLFIGMLEPRKNITGLIQAFAKIYGKNPTSKLVIVGKKGWMYEDIFRMVEKEKLENSVVFTGFIPDKDLPLFYSAALAFVYPSFYEGFGIPVIEAMACGCPVITSNISSLREIAKGAAILVDPKNQEELIAAMDYLITNKKVREELILLGLERAQQFNWKETAVKTLKVYKSL